MYAPAIAPLPSHRFPIDQPAMIAASVAELGYAVVADVCTGDLLDQLREDAARALDLMTIEPGGSRYCCDFVERSPGMWRLLGDERYLALNRVLVGADELTIHRSAAIARMPGAPGQGWHTDNPRWEGEPDQPNAVLNRWDEFPAGMACYLGGCSPERGGLAVIEGSHRPDWPGPAALAAQDPRWADIERGVMPARCDLQGMTPIVCGPSDLVIFSAGTWHAALPHTGSQPRLVCGVILRPRRIRVHAPWSLPQHAHAFIASAPEHVRELCDGYVGFDGTWGR